jgi:hypothetical protein
LQRKRDFRDDYAFYRGLMLVRCFTGITRSFVLMISLILRSRKML